MIVLKIVFKKKQLFGPSSKMLGTEPLNNAVIGKMVMHNVFTFL